MAGRATRATQALDRAGVAYNLHAYEVAEKVGEGYGRAVAEAVGMLGSRVFKTLVADVDGEPVVAVISVDRRLSTKRVASAAGGKHCSLASPETAERVTGYVTGGISPFGNAGECAWCSTPRPPTSRRSPSPGDDGESSSRCHPRR